MKFAFAVMAAALAFATPALSQSGVVTYRVTGSYNPYNATSVTVDYNTQTITWHGADGFDFTEAGTSQFQSHAALIEEAYGDDEPIDTNTQ